MSPPRARGLAVAGLQYYGECWGGSAAGYAPAPESECNTPCTAKPSEMCGGGWRNSIYATGVSAPPPLPPPPASTRIKVVSWNTRNAQNPSGQTAQLGPRNADVILLQVGGGAGASYASGMNAYETNVAKSGKTWKISADGSVMTWRPIASGFSVYDLGQNSWPNNTDSTNNPHRTAARVAIDFGSTRVSFIGTHLDWNPFGNMTNHIENRTKLLQAVDGISGRKVFGGDINAWTEGPSSPEGNEQRKTISALEQRGPDLCVELFGRTACNDDATNNGWVPDHVYRSSGLKTISYDVVWYTSLSDHGMLVMELEIQ